MPPDDQSSFGNTVPAAVRRQLAAADEMARQAGVANMPPAEGEAPAEAQREGQREGQAETQTQAEPPQAPEQVHDRSEQSQPPPPSGDWEQKFRSLQGRFEQQLNQNREMRGELNGLREMVTQVQSRTAPPAQSQGYSPQGYSPQAPIPQADIEAYGPELIDGAQRWAEARISPRLQELEQRLLSVEGRAQQAQNLTVQQRCESELDRDVPNWRVLNNRQDFIDWLNQYDPFSGQQRMALIQDAYAAGNAPRCAAFFHAFSREASAVSPSSGISQPSSPAPGSGAGQVPLAQLAAPGRGSGPLQSPSAPPQQRIWSGDDIMRLSRERQRGLWDGREDEYDRRFQDVINAGREGRYRPMQ